MLKITDTRSLLAIGAVFGALAAGVAGRVGQAAADPIAAPSARAVIVDSAQPAAAGTSDDSSSTARASDGLFYVTATVNGRPVRFLVDTGASVIVLTAADAAAVGAAPDAARFNAKVETAGGKAAMAWTTLDQVSLAGRDVKGLRAAVVRQGLGVSLLGQNMLARMGSVRIEGDRLELN